MRRVGARPSDRGSRDMSEGEKVKGVILSAARDQLQRMLDGDASSVPTGEPPGLLAEKIDPAAWYTLDQLNASLVGVREWLGGAGLQAFGYESAAGLAHTGIYKQFEVTLEEHGFSLGTKLMLSFAGVSHPYTEWRFTEIAEETGGTIAVDCSAGWSDEQCAVTCGWVEYLAQKLYRRRIRATWRRSPAGDAEYRIELD